MACPAVLKMGELEDYMDEAFLKQAFRHVGEEALNVKIMREKKTGLKTGYGFIEMASSEAMQKAITRLHGKVIPFTIPQRFFNLTVASFGNEFKLLPDHTLYVSNLTDDVTDEQMFEFFVSRYPSCRNAKVMIDEHGNSKGCGYVRFQDEWEQKKSLIEMQHMMGLGLKPVRVAVASLKKPHQPYHLVPKSVFGEGREGEAAEEDATRDENGLVSWDPFAAQNSTQYRYSAGYDASRYLSLLTDGNVTKSAQDSYAHYYRQSLLPTAVESTSSDEELVDPEINDCTKAHVEQFMLDSEDLFRAIGRANWEMTLPRDARIFDPPIKVFDEDRTEFGPREVIVLESDDSDADDEMEKGNEGGSDTANEETQLGASDANAETDVGRSGTEKATGGDPEVIALSDDEEEAGEKMPRIETEAYGITKDVPRVPKLKPRPEEQAKNPGGGGKDGDKDETELLDPRELQRRPHWRTGGQLDSMHDAIRGAVPEHMVEADMMRRGGGRGRPDMPIDPRDLPVPIAGRAPQRNQQAPNAHGPPMPGGGRAGGGRGGAGMVNGGVGHGAGRGGAAAMPSVMELVSPAEIAMMSDMEIMMMEEMLMMEQMGMDVDPMMMGGGEFGGGGEQLLEDGPLMEHGPEPRPPEQPGLLGDRPPDGAEGWDGADADGQHQARDTDWESSVERFHAAVMQLEEGDHTQKTADEAPLPQPNESEEGRAGDVSDSQDAPPAADRESTPGESSAADTGGGDSMAPPVAPPSGAVAAHNPSADAAIRPLMAMPPPPGVRGPMLHGPPLRGPPPPRLLMDGPRLRPLMDGPMGPRGPGPLMRPPMGGPGMRMRLPPGMLAARMRATGMPPFGPGGARGSMRFGDMRPPMRQPFNPQQANAMRMRMMHLARGRGGMLPRMRPPPSF